VPLAVPPEEKHPADGGQLPPLVVHHKTQRLKVAAGDRAHGRERLGSGSEVQGFRVEAGHRLLVEGLAEGEATKLLDHLAVGPPVGGAHAHIDARLRPLALEVVRAGRARVNLHGQDLGAAPGQDLDFRYEARSDVIADQVGQPLLQIERLDDASDMAALVLHPEQQRSALNSRVLPSGRFSSPTRSIC